MGGTAELSYNFHGIRVDMCGSPSILAALASRFGQLPQDPGSASELHFEFESAVTESAHRIHKPRGQERPFYTPLVGEAIYFPECDELYLDYGGRVRALCRPAEGRCTLSLLEPELDQLWLATHPLLTIPFIEMLKRRGKFNVHAAAFARHGRALLLPGTTGAGKSTLTVCLLRAGFDFLGDDMAFLEDSSRLRVLAFPENIDVTETTATFFAELKDLTQRPLRLGWPKHEIRSTDFFASRIAWSAEPSAVVFPQIGNVAASTLTPISSDEAFQALAPNVLLTEMQSSKAHFEALARLANVVPCYRLRTGRDFEYIPHLLGELLS